jgi:arginase
LKQRPHDFDLVLSYPQWQGSGRSENLRRGAQAAAEICAGFGPLVAVTDAGEGEDRNGINRWTSILEQFGHARSLLEEHRPRRVLTAGGDCACDIAVIDYLHGEYPNLTVIWVDAHLDANTPSTSPSGNFHGMPVAAIMGDAPEELRAQLTSPLLPSQFRYASARVGDRGDWDFQKANQLSWLNPDEPLGGPIHVHFDLDALDPSEFPHVAYPDGELSMQAGLDLVRMAGSTGHLVGLTITEFSPVDRSAAEDGGRFLLQLCEAATAR